MAVQRLSVCATIASIVFLSACATIENPEDCDIRCGFGANDRFEAENDARREDLQNMRAAQRDLLNDVEARRLEKERLSAQAETLRSEVALQSAEMSKIKEIIVSDEFRLRVTDAELAKLVAEVENVEAEIRRLESIPDDITDTEIRVVTQKLNNVVKPARARFSDLIEEVSIQDNF